MKPRVFKRSINRYHSCWWLEWTDIMGFTHFSDSFQSLEEAVAFLGTLDWRGWLKREEAV